MAKIKVTSKCAIYDGMIMTFKAPCDCTVADGINVYVQNEKHTFLFRDAHGNDVSGIDDLFTIDTYVTVSLDTTSGYAYLQNADTNAYLEEALAGKSNTTHTHALTSSAITGTLPVSKGGTGATTADAALANLGALGSAGGILTTNASFRGATTASQVSLQSAPSAGGGSGLWVYGNDHANAGQFRLQTYNTSAKKYYQLRGNPDGTLKWDGILVAGADNYGSTLPTAGAKGRLFYKKVTS